MKDIRPVEHQTRPRVFVGSLLCEEDGAVHTGAGWNQQLSILAGNVLAVFAERVGDGAGDGIAGAGAIAEDRIG
jgi:hypothetical protein